MRLSLKTLFLPEASGKDSFEMFKNYLTQSPNNIPCFLYLSVIPISDLSRYIVSAQQLWMRKQLWQSSVMQACRDWLAHGLYIICLGYTRVLFSRCISHILPILLVIESTTPMSVSDLTLTQCWFGAFTPEFFFLLFAFECFIPSAWPVLLLHFWDVDSDANADGIMNCTVYVECYFIYYVSEWEFMLLCP